MTVLEGLIDSVNAVAINTLDRIGTRYSYEFGKNKFHLNGLYDGMNGVSDVDYAPLGLGGLTNGLTVLCDLCEPRHLSGGKNLYQGL